MRRSTSILVVSLLWLSACAETPRHAGEASASQSGDPWPVGASLFPAPAHFRDKCRNDPRLQPACPAVLPVVDGTYKVGRYRVGSTGTGAGYVLLDTSYGGLYPRLTPKNAPPRFVHIVLKAGDLTQAFPFRFPDPSMSPAELPSHYAEAPLALARYTWGTKTGVLVLWPAFPIGGLDGGHLIFTWSVGMSGYAVSLHAWSPLSDAITTLQGIVASIP